jgi:hypothetical protein
MTIGSYQAIIIFITILPDNKFSIIPYDYDNTFGVDWFTKDWSRINPYTFAVIGGDRPLVDQIFSSAEV